MLRSRTGGQSAARYFAVIVERNGVEVFRKPLHVRKMSEVADGLAVASVRFGTKYQRTASPLVS